MTTLQDILKAHAFYLSDADDLAMDTVFARNFSVGLDWADFAKRTCLCGTRVDGFDEAHEHLLEVIERTAE